MFVLRIPSIVFLIPRLGHGFIWVIGLFFFLVLIFFFFFCSWGKSLPYVRRTSKKRMNLLYNIPFEHVSIDTGAAARSPKITLSDIFNRYD